ncbi:MAG: hypothetical protein M3Y82_08370, partial [Verrucomicrobiota bacterium]|nr:hypothetical protein [Verrucomicrobiota bacterium]
MKKHFFVSALLLTASGNALFAQGQLTPPAPPAPTMKTLSQIEPRTDVLKLAGDASNLFIITNTGSYYLTTNIVGVAGKNGIQIVGGKVTLDLNGFAVMGAPGSLVGIYITGNSTNITVRDGIVT